MSCDQNGNEIYVQQNDNELYVQQNDNDIFIQRNNNDFYEKRTSSFCCKKGKAVSHLLPTSPAAYVTITSVLCLLIAAGYIYQDLNFKLLTLQKQLDAYTVSFTSSCLYSLESILYLFVLYTVSLYTLQYVYLHVLHFIFL